VLFKKNSDTASLKWKVIGLAGKLFIDFLFLFSRVEIRGFGAVADIIASRRYIYAIWHSRILLPAFWHRDVNASILVSNSSDGEIVAQMLQRYGHQTIRGSTGKQGMRALMRQAADMRRHVRPGVVTPDGPQGPRHQVHPGVVLLAQKTGYPIIALAFSARQRKVFNSWDRFVLPLPWSKCTMVYGNPLFVPDTIKFDEKTLTAHIQKVENELNRVTAIADTMCGHHFEP
jgi:lysophospholipid acyltransferase (LPLAT)-like uncharacterized protein